MFAPVRRLRPVPIVSGVVALVVLWLVRPIWHGLAMSVWTSPIVWLPPVVVLAIAAYVLRRSRRSWTTLEDLRAGVRPPAWLAALPILAFVLLIVGGALQGPLVGRAIVKATRYEPIDGLPSGGQVRLVPREVAEQNASSAFNSPTETLTDFRIVNTPQGLRWTALRTPQGAFRVFAKKSQGLVELDATQTARSLRQVDARFDVAPGLQITDNLRWKLLKRHFLVSLEDPVAIETPKGPRIMVPYLQYKGFLVRRPVLGGVFVVAPDGTIEDLEPREAARRPGAREHGPHLPGHAGAAGPGRLPLRRRPVERVVRRTRTRRRSPTRSPTASRTSRCSRTSGPQWVTVAEPYGARLGGQRDLPDGRGDRPHADLARPAPHVAERQPARDPGRAGGVDPGDRLRGRARRVGQLQGRRAAAGVRQGAARVPHVDHPHERQRRLEDRRRGRRDEQARRRSSTTTATRRPRPRRAPTWPRARCRPGRRPARRRRPRAPTPTPTPTPTSPSGSAPTGSTEDLRRAWTTSSPPARAARRDPAAARRASAGARRSVALSNRHSIRSYVMTNAVDIFEAQARDYEAQRRRLIPPYDAFYGTALAALRTRRATRCGACSTSARAPACSPARCWARIRTPR